MESDAPAILIDQTIGDFPCFTSRELSILQLAAKGCTNVQIAASLHISKYTVAQHIAKMLHRTGAANRTDLVSRAHTVGILNDEPDTKQLAIQRNFLSRRDFSRSGTVNITADPESGVQPGRRQQPTATVDPSSAASGRAG